MTKAGMPIVEKQRALHMACDLAEKINRILNPHQPRAHGCPSSADCARPAISNRSRRQAAQKPNVKWPGIFVLSSAMALIVLDDEFMAWVCTKRGDMLCGRCCEFRIIRLERHATATSFGVVL
jgi:hypothetical protein